MHLSDLVRVILTLLNWFSWLMAVTAVAMGLYSGFLFITARDDASKMTSAKKVLVFTVIGIAAAVLSFSIVAIVKSLLAV